MQGATVHAPKCSKAILQILNIQKEIQISDVPKFANASLFNDKRKS